jgi:hypothetical protein
MILHRFCRYISGRQYINKERVHSHLCQFFDKIKNWAWQKYIVMYILIYNMNGRLNENKNQLSSIVENRTMAKKSAISKKYDYFFESHK